jgi:hypothetical protein
MKKIIFSDHAIEQMVERGASKDEVGVCILKGEKVPAKSGRHAYRMNFQYDNRWSGKYYATKQIMPIVKEEDNEIIIITVYTFYF